jgi:hypothetical protein
VIVILLYKLLILHVVNHDAPPTIIDGKSIAEEIKSEISKMIRDLKSSYGEVPGLAVIFVFSGAIT